MKVLIVDDFRLNREFLAKLFPSYAKCDLVDSGKKALAVIENALHKQENYDLVCLDLVMPEMDGFEVLTKIRLIETETKPNPVKNSKILVTTSKKDSATVAKAIQMGCDGYLTKPFSGKQLLKYIQTQLEK